MRSDLLKIRRTLCETRAPSWDTRYRAENLDTGEVIECQLLVPLLQSLSERLAPVVPTERQRWSIERVA